MDILQIKKALKKNEHICMSQSDQMSQKAGRNVSSPNMFYY
jgi:hypothetical protein